MKDMSSTQLEPHAAMQPVTSPPVMEGATEDAQSPPPASPSGPLADPTVDQEEWKAGRQELVILLTLSIISLIVALDSTIFLPALHVLARDLHGNSVATFWVGTSYLLANAAFLPLIGAVSDIFGRRELLMGSLLFFTAGSIICCTANDFPQLLAGRTVQGIGGGGISTLSLVVLTDIVPLRQRPKYQSLILMAWGLGTMLGPLIGGAISQRTTWRWLFYINFPFCGIGLLVVPLTVRLRIKEQRTITEKIARVDWVGGGLFIAGTASFLLGLTWGGIQYPWSGYQAWLPMVLGLVGILLSLVYEGRFAKHPFLPLRLFRSISASVVYFGALVLGLVLYANSYYLALYLESVKGLNEILTGVCILLVNVLFFPTSIFTGVTISKRGAFLWAVWAGWILLVLGEGLLLLLDQGISVPVSVVIICVGGIGQGSLISSLNSATQSIAHAKDVSYAVTMFTFMRTFGMCLGVAIGGTVFENVLLKALIERDLPTAVAGDSAAFVAILREMEPGTERSSYRAAYVEAFQGIFYVCLALSAFCLVLTFWVKHHNMDIKLTSEHRIKEKKGEKSGINEVELLDTSAGTSSAE